MIFRNLDRNGDWTFGKGKNNYVKLNEAIGLNIKTRLQSWLNDCFFALNEGVDWRNRLGSTNQRLLLEQDLKRIVLQSEGVTGLLDFQSAVNNRNISVYFSIETIYSLAYQQNVNIGV